MYVTTNKVQVTKVGFFYSEILDITFGITQDTILDVIIIFCNIFFFVFKNIYSREAYFINYNLQTKEKKSTTHFTRPLGY